MSKQDRIKMQTFVLRVNIHCDGCKDKVEKLIQKIDGVYSTSTDAEQGKVVVSGTVDPARVIQKLKKSGKHAELCGGQRPNTNNQNGSSSNQFNHFNVSNGKGGKGNKPQQKGEQQHPQLKGGHLAQMHMKGTHYNGFKLPSKDQKSVKFNVQDEEFDASDDGFDGSDDYDEFDEVFDGDDDNDEHEYGNGHYVGSKMTSTVGNGYGQKGPAAGRMLQGHPMNDMKRGGREANENFKNGGAIDLPVQMKSTSSKNYSKHVNVGKRGKGDGEVVECKRKKGGKGKGGDGVKNKNGAKGGGGLLGFLGFGKKNTKSEGGTKKNNKSNSVGPVMSGVGQAEGKAGKRDSGKFDELHDVIDVNFNQRTKGGGPMGGINNFRMGQIANYPMGPVRDFSAVQGLPYNYQGQPMQPPPSYPQYMQMPMRMPVPMMMDQQHQTENGNGTYPSVMYAGPHPPPMKYMLPPPMPSHPMNDPVTHIFSDENTESCSIM